jgi:SAM-dependent methyltransferase
MKCRACQNTMIHLFADLDYSPPSNAYLSLEQLSCPEIYFPLRLMVCEKCFLVQLDEFANHTDIFDNNYAYFSSYSSTWLAHAKAYTAKMTERFQLKESSQVIEIASNDGYLLQYFKEKGIPVLGVEPTANTAAVAQKKDIETIIDFFGVRLAEKLTIDGIKADLLLGNNVLAHVPDINDFVCGMKLILKDEGVITMEFPHLLQLVEQNQFDTIYHEHYSYLSLLSVEFIFGKNGLRLFDVEELNTHGGSLRIYACHEESNRPISEEIKKVRKKEYEAGMSSIEFYSGFQLKMESIKSEFVEFLIDKKKTGKKIMGYGAAAKGNTLLNFSGVKRDWIFGVVDLNPHKQNKFLPGSHIPILPPEIIKEEKPDYIIIFPWNIKDEIMEQLNYVKDWGAKFVIFIPQKTEFNG